VKTRGLSAAEAWFENETPAAAASNPTATNVIFIHPSSMQLVRALRARSPI
jgi:hypothetical protein